VKFSLNSIFRACCYMSLAISFLPVVDYYCPWYITIIPAAIALGITLYKDRNVYPLIIALFSILGLWFLTYWVIYRDHPIANNLINFIISFIPCILAIQANRTVTDKDFFEGYLKTMSIFVGITCITTIIGLIIYPMASRQLASGSAIWDTERYTRINIGGYEFIYALVLLIPVFLWLIKRARGLWKAIYIIILTLDICCIYASQYTIALVCAVVALIVVALQNNQKLAWICTILIAIFLLFNGLSLLGKMFYWVSDIVDQEYVSDRLLQLAQLFSGQTVSTETSSERLDHYFNQVNEFLNSPVLGHNLLEYSNTHVSGHSLFLDLAGGAGIFGVSVLIFLIQKLYRLAVNPSKQRVLPHIRSLWIMAILLALLNPIIFSTTLTVVFMGCMCMNQLNGLEFSMSERGC